MNADKIYKKYILHEESITPLSKKRDHPLSKKPHNPISGDVWWNLSTQSILVFNDGEWMEI